MGNKRRRRVLYNKGRTRNMLIPTNVPVPYKEVLVIAERDPTSAIKMARHILEQHDRTNTVDQAWLLYSLGWSLLRRYELKDALTHLQQAQVAFEAIGQLEMILHCRRAILIGELAVGAATDCQAAWDNLVADYYRAGLDLDAMRTQTHQIGYFNLIGSLQNALALGREIELTIQVCGTDDDWARWLRVMAIAFKHAGQIHQAQTQLEQAVEIFKRLGCPIEVAKCLVEQAHVMERQGELTQAGSVLNQALELFQTCEVPLQVAAVEKNLGIIASWLGELDRALMMTLRARTTFLQAQQYEQAANCDLSLGNIAFYSGLFDLALGIYKRAQSSYTDLGLQRQLLISRRNQTLVLQEQGQCTAAYAALSDLEVEVAALGDDLELAEVYQAQAQTLRRLGRYDAALERLSRAEHQLARLGRQIGVAECWLERGHIYLNLGDTFVAEACLQTAQANQKDQPIYIWRVLYGLGRCAEAQGAVEIALEHYQTASSMIAHLRHTLVDEHASSALFVQARSLYEDAIRLAATTQYIPLVLTLAEQHRALALHQRLMVGHLHIPATLAQRYEAQRQALQTLISTTSTAEQLDAMVTEYTDLLLQLIHSAPLPERLPQELPDVQQIRRTLDRVFTSGWLVLNYVECGSELLIIMLDSTTLTLTTTQIDQHLMRLLERACLARLRSYTFNDFPRLRDPSCRPWDTLSQLADVLIPSEARTRFHPDVRLIIVPSERLHNLPWATLRIGDSWLCEHAILQTVPSLSLWELYTSYALTGSDALLIGCSEFGDRANSLPNIEAELSTVCKSWTGRATRLYNSEATRGSVLRLSAEGRLAQYALIHIASHAQLSAAQGLLAHVMLWDEDMLYDEVSRLGLNGALVVLSTCDGAASEVLPGDEVMNLSRAFLRAGARDVIANLWPSYDEVAPELMRQLYTQLKAGCDTAQAVAQMQRTLLAQPEHAGDNTIKYHSPLVWGGFHVVGSGTTSQGSTRGNPH